MKQNLFILFTITLLANCASRESVRNAEILKSQAQSNKIIVSIIDASDALRQLNQGVK
jgi:hypothetical protein